MQPEKPIQPSFPVETSTFSAKTDPHLFRLALLRWVQRQINTLLARWRLLCLTHGRGNRWLRAYRRLLQCAAALLLVGGMLLSPLAPAMPAYAGAIFTEQTGTSNPLNYVDVVGRSAPAFVDIDQDGDMDAFIGDGPGTLNYHKNNGTPLTPDFDLGTGNPFGSADVGSFSTPTFVDIDGDGDMDAFIGEYDGVINYYKNTGTALAPAFSEQSGTSNPLNVGAGYRSYPAFVDIDGDGDMDAFIGESSGTLKYYQNIGTALAPAFSEQTGANNPLDDVDVGTNSVPSFVDIDHDGDMDTFVGEYYGSLKYYKNTGTALTPAFSEQTGANNPVNGVDVGFASAPSFVDVDGDGDMDIFIGEYYGTIKYHKNIGDDTRSPFFIERTGSYLSGVDVGSRSKPVFVDIDQDGDMDVFVGELNSGVYHYKNTGNALTPAFTPQLGTSNPLNGVALLNVCPAFVDIDGDGDMDAFIGEKYGTIKYYKNTGNAIAAAFSEQTGTNNPFNALPALYYNAPTFVDIDGDGDMDAFIGEAVGILNYYKNTGTALAPAFSEQTGISNPFDDVDLGTASVPTFVDIDGDGDMDAFIGASDGRIKYDKNTGTPLAPGFVQQTEANNPLRSADVGTMAAPTSVDIDGDGKMEAFSGNMDGRIKYFDYFLHQVFLPLVSS